MSELRLPKPRYGTPCNRCGFCCLSERCRVAEQLIGNGPGPCPALEWDGVQSACGLLRHPDRYIPGFALSRLLNGPKAAGEAQASIAYSLAIGRGCDTDDDVALDWNTQLELRSPKAVEA